MINNIIINRIKNITLIRPIKKKSSVKNSDALLKTINGSDQAYDKIKPKRTRWLVHNRPRKTGFGKLFKIQIRERGSGKMNNSMFTTEPPSIILAPTTPKEIEDAKIREHLDEENINNSFVDFETVRFRELINNGKSERNW